MGNPQLKDIIDLDELASQISDGFIRTQTNFDGTLRIFNYTPAAQFSKEWTHASMTTRGLIVDENDVVIARPFPKFFNYGEEEAQDLIVGSFKVAEKLDGSLAIAYPAADGTIAIATRGSFMSDQAIDATQILKNQHSEWRPEETRTYLFEYIAPVNRIVLDYGARKELVLLAIIDNETGSDCELPGNWTGAVARQLQGIKSFNDIVDMMGSDPGDEEGFVVTFDTTSTQPNARVKLKYGEYVRLHRIITGTNARDVWRILALELIGDVDDATLIKTAGTDLTTVHAIQNSGGISELIEKLPDEMHPWLQRLVAKYTTQWETLEKEYRNVVEQTDPKLERKELAETFKNSGLEMGTLFAMWDGKDSRWRSALLRSISPSADSGDYYAFE